MNTFLLCARLFKITGIIIISILLCNNVQAQCPGIPLLDSRIDGGGSVCEGRRSSIIIWESYIEQTYNIYRNDTLILKRKGKGIDQTPDSFHYTINVLPKDIGKYTVKTFIEGCTDTLELTPVNPSFVSGDNSIKIQFIVGGGGISGQGTYCPADNSVNIGISTTFEEQTYIWALENKVIAKKKGKGTSGNGDATSYNFTISSKSEAGIWIVKTYIEGCKDTIQFNPVQVNYYDTDPVKQTLVGGGTVCSTTGQVIGLSGSEINYEYTLVKDSVPFQRTLSRVIGNGAPINFPPVFTSGTYRVIVKRSFNCGDDIEIGKTDLQFLPSPPKPVISKNGATDFCAGASVQLSSSATAGNQWLRDGIQIPNATNNSLSASIAGVYTVQTTTGGCISPVSDGVTVTITPLPEAIAVSEGSTSFCETGSVTLKANTGTGLSYQWRKNGTNISGATSVSYVSNSPGVYDVLVSTSNGCTKPSNAITANILTSPPKPTITKDASGSFTFCSGSSLLLTSSASTGNKWFRDGIEIPNAVSNTYNASVAGIYTVQASTNNCVSPISDGAAIIVTPLPEASIVAAGPTTFCENGTVLLNANTGAGLSYVWRKDGNTITGATTANYNASASGIYDVVVSSGSSCFKISNTVTVAVSSTLSKPLITKEGGGSNSFCTGSPVTLKSSSSSGNKWFRDGIEIPNATGSSYSVTLGGVYTVQVSANNCTSPISDGLALSAGEIPDANIIASGPTTFCENGTVLLSANTGAGLSYVWRKDGNAITGATTATYNTSVSGVYDVVVSSASGCLKTSNTVNVTVSSTLSKPLITKDGGGSNSFCIGSPVTLKSSSSSGNKWFRDGIEIPNATSNSYSATSGGVYTVQVIANNCISPISEGLALSASDLPDANITATGPTAFCENGTLLLSANTGIGVSYQWRKDGTSISGASTSSYTVNTSGIFDVVITNQAGCTKISNTIQATVQSIGKPTISASGATNICSGQSLTLTSSSPTGNKWYRDGVEIQNSNNSSLLVSTLGKYTVRTEGNGCISPMSDGITVTVNNIPEAIISASGPTIICGNGTLQLSANSGTGLSYQWRKDGTNIAGATSANLGVVASGSYDIVVTNQSGCAKTSNSIQSSINPLPPKPLITKDGNDMISSSDDGNQWFLDNTAIAGATSKRYTPDKSGNYKVRVSLNGCESEFSDVINFVATGIINLPNSQFIKVFPNPVSSNGTIYLAWKLNNAPKGLRVNVVNLTGQIISMNTITDPIASLKLPGISGIYYLRVWVTDNEAANYTLRVLVH